MRDYLIRLFYSACILCAVVLCYLVVTLALKYIIITPTWLVGIALFILICFAVTPPSRINKSEAGYISPGFAKFLRDMDELGIDFYSLNDADKKSYLKKFCNENS